MTKFLTDARDSLVYWRVAILHTLLYAAMSGGGAFLTVTSNLSAKQWSDMAGFDRAKLYIGIGLVVGGTLKAFLDKTMSELREDVDAPTAQPQSEKKG